MKNNIVGLPEDIANNSAISRWRKFTKTGALVSEFKRIPTGQDKPAIIDHCAITEYPVFYGEWVQTPQVEIDKWNEERVNKSRVSTVRQQTAREIEIEKAQALLQQLLDKINGNVDKSEEDE